MGILMLAQIIPHRSGGRIIQTLGTNITNGIDKSTTQYSWAGIPIRVLDQHVKSGQPNHSHMVLTKMDYDHSGRLLTIKKSIESTINGSSFITPEKTVATYSYNEIGQLKSKALGTHPTIGGPLETLAYDYNVRG